MIDLDTLRDLLVLLGEHDVRAFTWRDGDTSVTLELGGPEVATAPAAVMPAAAAAPPEPTPQGLTVDAPMVGTFYVAKTPGGAPFVQVGDRVAVGDTLCIIEAMKLMNPIEAEVAGTVAARLVEDGTAVEYGQALFRIVPD